MSCSAAICSVTTRQFTQLENSPAAGARGGRGGAGPGPKGPGPQPKGPGPWAQAWAIGLGMGLRARPSVAMYWPLYLYKTKNKTLKKRTPLKEQNNGNTWETKKQKYGFGKRQTRFLSFGGFQKFLDPSRCVRLGERVCLLKVSSYF